MNPEPPCARCGAPVQSGLLGGHCPKCLVSVTMLAEDPDSGLEAIRTFGSYEVLREIARGGMGIVYRARQIGLNRIVALKMIREGEFASAEFVARFRNEAESAARLRHPNIVTVYEVGEHEGRHYFAMEFVDGPTFAELVRDGPLPARRAATYLKAVAEAVAHAHAQRVLHRDLKPSNILLDPFDQPRVTDFGLALQLDADASLTLSGQTIGSPGYMSPEQALGKSALVGPAADVYSLGAVLYHLLAGRAPFQGETIPAVLRQVESAEPISPRRLNPSVPADLETICLKCVEKEPARRYLTAKALADELGRFLRDEPIHARPMGAFDKLWRWCRRRPAVAALSASVLLLLIVVAVGSSLSVLRVSAARRAESAERQKSDAANRDLIDANARLAGTVRVLELRRAEEFFRGNESDKGVAQLAAILRRDPSNHIAASRLVSAMVHRRWALPSAPLIRHQQPVESACFSPDGRQVLSVSRENFARIWDSATSESLAGLRHADRVVTARYSGDGLRVVTASSDGTARIWNSINGSPLSPPLVHKGRVNWAEFSYDGRLVVTASDDKTARIWDGSSGALRRELRGHGSRVSRAVFSPDDVQVATGGEGGSVRIWKVASGELVFRLQNGPAQTTALEFSRDGRRMVWAGDNGIAQLWDPDTGLPAGRPMINADYRPQMLYATFSPDSRTLLTTAEDGSALLWDGAAGHLLGPRFTHDGGVTFGAFSPDGATVITASGDVTARLWDVRNGNPRCQPLRAYERIAQAVFSADGGRVVTAAYDWTVQVWDVEPRPPPGIDLSQERGIRSVAFSPDGESILTASLDRLVRRFDARTGWPLGQPLLHAGPVHSAQFSPEGGRMLTASGDGTANIYDAQNGQLLAGPFQHTKVIWSAWFSPDGEQVVTASADGTARVWDARTGKPITPPLSHDGEVVLARFSPDGRRVATASEDFSARVWDAQTGRPVTERLPHLDHLKWVEFSPNGERVVTTSSDNTACLWSVATGRPIAPRLRHTRIVDRAAFSPDGRRVVTCSLDLTARVWDATTGQALTEPLKHEAQVTRVSFSPDGRRILTGGLAGGVRLWDAETGLPLTEWLEGSGVVTEMSFDPTGERIAIAARGARVWDVPTAPTPVPAWFPEFAEAVAGMRLSERGNVELVPRQALGDIAGRIKPEGAAEFYDELGRWVLSDPARRQASPFQPSARTSRRSVEAR